MVANRSSENLTHGWYGHFIERMEERIWPKETVNCMRYVMVEKQLNEDDCQKASFRYNFAQISTIKLIQILTLDRH